MEKAIITQSNKRKREELYLPSLRFAAADDWIEKIGPIAFCAWLRLHTFVDRRDVHRTQDIIPTSLIQLANRLGMSKSKFYKTVVKPLWNHGLIDIVEYENSTSLGQKPKNIIVYRSPFNHPGTDVQPLPQVRDYDTEYISIAREFGRRGGQPRHKVKVAPVMERETATCCTEDFHTTHSIQAVVPCHITDEPPGIQNEPVMTGQHIDPFTPHPGSNPEPSPVSNLYPIIETNTRLIDKEKITTCVYNGVENDFNTIEIMWMDCFDIPLSPEGYADLVTVLDPQFIQQTLMDIKVHEGQNGIARIHDPFKFIKSLLRREGYIVSAKRKKHHRSIAPKAVSTYCKPTDERKRTTGFTFYNWLQAVSAN